MRYGITGLANRLYPGTLWGHGTRGLVWNPVFALLPVLYLERFASSDGAPAIFWLLAFFLGFPHAGYTALEIRHYFQRDDGVADSQTWSQACFFGAYAVFGGALAAWYVARGGGVLGERLSINPYILMPVLALAGAVGTVMGLQDVLVMDLLVRPSRVLRASVRALTSWACLRITLAWALLQLALASILRACL